MDKMPIKHWLVTLWMTLYFAHSNGYDSGSSSKHRMFSDAMRKFVAYQPMAAHDIPAAELAQSTVIPTYMRELFFRYRNSDVPVGATVANTVRSINAEIGRLMVT